MTTPEVHTDPVSDISFRATPEGWERRYGDGVWWPAVGTALAALRLFGPPLPEKPRTVTLDNGDVWTHENSMWFSDSARSDEARWKAMLLTLDRLQNGPVSEGDDR